MEWKTVEPMGYKGTRRRHHTLPHYTREQAVQTSCCLLPTVSGTMRIHLLRDGPRVARCSPGNARPVIEFRRWRVFLPLFPSMPGGCRPDNFISIKEREGTGGCGAQVPDGAGRSSPEEKPEESGRRASAPGRGPGSLLCLRHNNTGYHATCTLVQGVLQYDGLGT